MKIKLMLVAGLLVVCCSWVIAEEKNSPESQASPSPASDSAPAAEEPPDTVEPPGSIAEARSRARILHEMIHGALQVMHRDFFDEDEAIAIPSASLEDVFHEMSVQHDVEMKWLTVNTDLINVDHEAEEPFEKQAVQLLAAGKPYAEHAGPDQYQFAGAIHLGATCLKCHIKRRTSNEDRTAGLIITMPMKTSQRVSKKGSSPESVGVE